MKWGSTGVPDSINWALRGNTAVLLGWTWYRRVLSPLARTGAAIERLMKLIILYSLGGENSPANSYPNSPGTQFAISEALTPAYQDPINCSVKGLRQFN
jgi:hypothetical protein